MKLFDVLLGVVFAVIGEPVGVLGCHDFDFVGFLVLFCCLVSAWLPCGASVLYLRVWLGLFWCS